MLVEEIMVSDVYKVNEEATVKDVIRILVEHGIGGLPVVDQFGELKGFISDGDIMGHIGKEKDFMLDTLYSMGVSSDDRNFAERIASILDLNVMKLAKKRVSTVGYDKKVEEVATILSKKKFKKIPVVKDRKLVGIISRKDIVRESFKDYLMITE